MAKIAKKLTDTEIKNTKPADKEINLFDGDGGDAANLLI